MDVLILLGIILVAIAVQYIVEALKSPVAAIFKFRGIEDKLNPLFAPFLSLAWAIALCYLAGLDIFIAFGYPLANPIVGSVVSGLIASLGAGKVYDLIMEFQDYKDRLAVEKQDIDSTKEFDV
jgi:divalent metal cation (Fe/Co/Zn/Cd) transporter